MQVSVSDEIGNEIRRIRATPPPVLASAAAPQPGSGPIVLSVMRNEMPRIPTFLAHYRGLGIRRFAIVDDHSDDGTGAFLAAQPDVDLWRAGGSFSTEAKHGWIDHLTTIYGHDRWFVLADADEHIVYDKCDQIPIRALADWLASRGQSRARGMLVDMYAQGAVQATCRPTSMPMLDAYPLFDGEGYFDSRTERLTSRVGGPRMRVFSRFGGEQVRPELTKYPLFRPGPSGCAVNPHFVWPRASVTEDRCILGILHFKFDGAALTRVRAAVKGGRYWNSSAEYRAYLAALEQDPDLTFAHPRSMRYRGPDSLIAAGLVEPLDDFDYDDGPVAVFNRAMHRRRAIRLADGLTKIEVGRGGVE